MDFDASLSYCLKFIYVILVVPSYWNSVFYRFHSLTFFTFCRKTVSRQDLITAPTESRFQVDIDKNWVESTKVSVLLRELEALRLSGSKSIVFSQWTAFLDLLEIPLSR